MGIRAIGLRPGEVIVTSQRMRAASENVSERTKSDLARAQDTGRRNVEDTYHRRRPQVRPPQDSVVDAEPVASHPEVMRVKGFGAFENGARLGVGLVR